MGKAGEEQPGGRRNLMEWGLAQGKGREDLEGQEGGHLVPSRGPCKPGSVLRRRVGDPGMGLFGRVTGTWEEEVRADREDQAHIFLFLLQNFFF